MSRREAGYATFTVAALLSALSITGLGFMHLSQSTTSTAAALSEDILIDGALESMLAETLASLVNQQTDIDDYPTNQALTGAAGNVSIEVETEREKLGLHTASIEDIERALESTNIGETYKTEVAEAFRQASIGDPGHIAIKSLIPTNAHPGVIACLRASFTEHKVPAVFKRDSQRHLLDGEIYRIKISTAYERAPRRVLDATVLFTGDDEDPAWILGWDRYSITQKEC